MQAAEHPRVSVLLSVLNGGEYLAQAIEGILNQDLPDLEFIIINDGSSDDSWKIISRYAARDARILGIDFEAKQGTSRSLNAGLARCRGRYITRQDADDFSLSNRLSEQVRFLESNPEVGAVGTAVMLTDDQGAPIREDYRVQGSAWIAGALPDQMCLCGPTLMVRREVFVAAGYYFADDLSYTEDYDLCLRISEVSKIDNLPVVLYHYRQHSGSVSHSRRYSQMYKKALALERHEKRRYGDLLPEAARIMIARDYLRAAIIGFAAEPKEDVGGVLQKALATYPGLLESAERLNAILSRYTPGDSTDAAIRFTKRVFAELLPPSPSLKRARARRLCDLLLSEAFAAAQQGDARRVRKNLRLAISHQPSCLLNRGVLSLSLRHLF